MKVIVKKPIRMNLRRYSPPIKEDKDGMLYITVEPGEYELHEIEEYDVDGDVISINLPMMVGAFWSTDVGKENYEFPPVDSDHWSEKPWVCATKDEDVKPGHLCRP